MSVKMKTIDRSDVPKLGADELMPASAPSQLDKFKAAAREIGTDDDPERFKERVKRIGGIRPTAGTEKAER